jgi:hypothetical protein
VFGYAKPGIGVDRARGYRSMAHTVRERIGIFYGKFRLLRIEKAGITIEKALRENIRRYSKLGQEAT